MRRFFLLLSVVLCAPALWAQQPGGNPPPAKLNLTFPAQGTRPGVPEIPPQVQPPARLPDFTNVPKIATSDPAKDTKPLFIPPQPKNNLTSFDPQSAQVRWVNGRWELQAGNIWLKDFGTREQDAREALNVIRKLQLTQRGTIGQPVPIMEYWLSQGKAPELFGSSLRMSPIEQATLKLEEVQGNWCVRDAQRILFNFGPRQEDAQQALDVIRRHGFNQMGYVGYPRPAMIYFVKGQNAFGGSTIKIPNLAAPSIPRSDVPVSMTVDKSGNLIKEAKNNQTDINPALLQQANVLAQGLHQLNPPMSGNITQVRLDPKKLVLRQVNKDWKVFNGQHVVAEFGRNVEHARQALKVLQSYGCNEQHLIGKPLPSFSYFLVNGHAPIGLRHDLQGQLFQPDKITVKQIEQNWYVCEGTRPLLFFGPQKDDAQQLTNAIKRYRFDFITQIGPPSEPALSILVRSR